MTNSTSNDNSHVANRWVIALAGFFLQIALGAVYAWSVFRTPLAKQFGWSISEVTLTFTISIFVLGVSAFFGGLWLNRQGPRIVAMTGGALYGVVLQLSNADRLLHAAPTYAQAANSKRLSMN